MAIYQDPRQGRHSPSTKPSDAEPNPRPLQPRTSWVLLVYREQFPQKSLRWVKRMADST